MSQKQGRGCGWIMGVLVAMPLAAALLYWSWCWGWWGRENRFLRYLFQCQCPRVSEEGRYPDNVDVLVSACADPYYSGISVSPSSRYNIVYIRPPIDESHLYDSKIDSLQEFNVPGYGFLTDEIMWSIDTNQEYLLYDLAGNRISKLTTLPSPSDDSLNPSTLQILREARQVYVITPRGLIITLATDFPSQTSMNFVIEMSDYNNSHMSGRIAAILQANGLAFQVIHPGSNIIQPTPDIYLIGGAPPSPGIFRVLQPLLRQRLLLEELDPSVRPRVEAQRAQEITDKRNANVALVIGLVALVALLGITAFGIFRSLFGQQPRS